MSCEASRLSAVFVMGTMSIVTIDQLAKVETTSETPNLGSAGDICIHAFGRSSDACRGLEVRGDLNKTFACFRTGQTPPILCTWLLIPCEAVVHLVWHAGRLPI